MARYDFTSHRLFVDAPLSHGADVPLARPQTHYLINVLRLSAGAELLAFNGKDGEWRCALAIDSRKAAHLAPLEMTRPQPAAADLLYLFAPLKHARLDYMVQKAVEMGASMLRPVLTQHTHVERINFDRMQANVIEAAEQCGILNVPDTNPPIKFDALLANWPTGRQLIFCDEDAEADPLAILADVKARLPAGPPSLAVLIGPEGGFAAAERQQLLALPQVVRLSLGPRILRADTAAVAALALTQAVLGDWQA